LETTVTSLLLVTAAVVLACVVVNYAVNIVEQVANTDNIPQLDGIKNIENNLLNQTDQLFNETQPQLPSQPPP
jgi:predicted PurR-regulated permease PerM